MLLAACSSCILPKIFQHPEHQTLVQYCPGMKWKRLQQNVLDSERRAVMPYIRNLLDGAGWTKEMKDVVLTILTDTGLVVARSETVPE